MNVPSTYDGIFQTASARWGVPFEWLKAIAGAESDWTPSLIGDTNVGNSYGMMQIWTKTARDLGWTRPLTDLLDPAANVDLAAKLLADIYRRVGNNFQRAYSMYNSGDPDKYTYRSDVAEHVARAVRYLNAVTGSIGSVISELPEAVLSNPSTPLLAAVGAGLIAYLLLKKKK